MIKLDTRTTRWNDPLTSSQPCVTTFKNIHNHPVHNLQHLCQLKITDNTKQVFHENFNQGYTPATALRFHESKITTSGENVEVLANHCLNPTLRTAYCVWQEWKQTNYGSYVGDSMYSAITKYAESTDSEIQLRQIGNNSSDFVCAAVTPVMKRVVAVQQNRQKTDRS